jgi:spore maturation protein A
MLNYVWIGLVLIGVLAAAGSDIYDASTNRYRNGDQFTLQYDSLTENSGAVSYTRKYFDGFYGVSLQGPDTLRFPAVISGASLKITTDDNSPELWKTVAKTDDNSDQITARVVSRQGSSLAVLLPKTSLVRTKAVLDAVISYSELGVKIALGLIGVMAFWLGIMKLAEDSGMIKIIARVMKPVMTRVFPEIPPDHPAIGAMIMNIAANMLGLNNAATPLGLKAMDELEKLNPHKGTASNSMVTFLAINTAGLTLIPATAIAIRAALGSKDPTIILLTSFFGAGLATVAGITAARLLQRLNVYRIKDTDDGAKDDGGPK